METVKKQRNSSTKGTIGENMHYFWIGVLGAIALCWSVLGLRMVRGMAGVPRLSGVMPLADAECPKVSILFAARDEAATLPQTLANLLGQDYPHYEVIAVNDRSRDATPQILNEFARNHKNLKVVHLTELPHGWLGKPHALATAYQHATGDWLAFADADVRLAPELLRRALALAQEKRWDHLSFAFFVDLAGFWEKTVFGYWLLSIILWLEPWRVSDLQSQRYCGSGAFQLLRRSVYEAIGTHKRLALEIIEDIKLGKLVKKSGFRSGVALSEKMVRVRCYEGLRGIIHGLTKNSFAACDFRVRTLAVNLLLLFMFNILPFLALLFASSLPRALAAVSIAVLLFLRLITDRYYQVSAPYVFTHPLGAAIMGYILLRSTIVTLWRGGVLWRDTFYPLDELRRGLV